ncbi:hypothetical protein [Planobispora takensis]|uniref:ABC transporter ATP-binding protein n=1 Tax=Planobispora takensis TaxID=1367882 RepID=A0A8J3WY98_9ACTN|nr:hypothetical protein [Planobispora takensis]GII03607.1 hypothetical protein Pta02_56150 [Planobispora takensis]
MPGAVELSGVGVRVMAAGPVGEALTSENLSECFGRALRIDHLDGRWSARALRGSGARSV